MSKPTKVCLISNYSPYESKRYFTEKLAEAMHRHQIETKIIHVQQGFGPDVLSTIGNFSPDFTCSFNKLEPLEQGLNFWDVLKIPHLSILMNPSFYSTMLVNSPYSILSCVDRSDCEVIAESGFGHVFFWPHAVERELAFDEKEKRIYDVVFLGSCYDFESLRVAWQQRNPASLNKVLDDAIDLIFSDEKISLAQALVAAWQVSNLNPQGVDFATLYNYLDNYTRGKDRVELIMSIKNAKVHVFGELSASNAVGILSWKQYLASQSNVTVHPSVSFKEGLEILKHSKITLNSMPFFRDGSHERIFTGLACGSVPMTSESKYLHEQFEDGKELLFYQALKRHEVNAKINDLLNNEKTRHEMASRGREIVMQRHTWDQRVKELGKIMPSMLKSIRAFGLNNCSPRSKNDIC
jgi:spore maturation protein CgeB